MPIIATITLTLGVLLAALGTLIYVYVAMTAPDLETLRIAKGAAVAGRWSAITGTATYLMHAFATGNGASPPMLAVLLLAAVAAVATHVTKLPPPTHARPA